MFCTNCGKEIPSSDSFCPACGAAAQPAPEELESEPTVYAPDFEEGEMTVTADPWQMDDLLEEEPEGTVYVESQLPQQPAAEETPVYIQEPEVVAPVNQGPPAGKKIKYRKIRPHMALRAVMQMLSFVLCLILMVTMVAGVLLLDLRTMTSSKSMETVIKAIFSGNSHETTVHPAPQEPLLHQANSSLTVVPLADVDYEFNVDDIPQDVLTGGEENMDDLVGWIYEELQGAVEEDLEFSKDDLQEFVAESTMSEYLAEKMAGFADDFINGTENTLITTEELMKLVEENEAVLAEKLNIRLTEDDKKQLQEVFAEVVEEEKLNETIRQTVSDTMDEVLQSTVGVNFAAVQQIIRQVTSDPVLYGVLGACLLLMVLLCALNYYNVGAGFTWSAAAGIMAGGLLSLPLLVLEFGREVLLEMEPGMAGVMGAVDALAAPLMVIHYGLLYGSLAVFVLSIVWRIIAWDANRKRPVKA